MRVDLEVALVGPRNDIVTMTYVPSRSVASSRQMADCPLLALFLGLSFTGMCYGTRRRTLEGEGGGSDEQKRRLYEASTIHGLVYDMYLVPGVRTLARMYVAPFWTEI